MKIAVVTGGTKGIGRQIVKDLLRRQYRVYTNYSSDEDSAQAAALEFTAISPHFQIVKADQADNEAFLEFIQLIKSQETNVQCIVGNAGMTIRKTPMEFTNADWETMMQVIVNAHFYLVRDLRSLLTSDARIVFIGSMMGILPHGTSLAYGVAKSALHALGQNLVKEFEGTETTVNVIAPGFVNTDWQSSKPQVIKDSICDKTALHRFAEPEEISSAVLFCLDNSFVNGSIIEVNGGYCFK
ncbi:MAG TPA: SDR family oxidoreductase [Paludibacteraceae bacterium]|nr:SDR family oxidoreductase [Paludibacteraceae bacterium]